MQSSWPAASAGFCIGDPAVKLEEVLPLLGIPALRAFADAWNVEVIKKDDRAEYVRQLSLKRHELLDDAHVRPRVQFDDLPYPVHMLVREVLAQMLNWPGYVAPADDLHARLIEQENELLEWAAQPRSLQHLDRGTVENLQGRPRGCVGGWRYRARGVPPHRATPRQAGHHPA